MDKITPKTAFEQWVTPISNELFAEQVQLHCLDHYTKKLHMDSFTKLLLYAQLHETESLRAVSDSVFSEELQKATGLDSISFSQLGRRLRQVPTEFFQAIFLDLVAQIHDATDFQTRRKRTTPLKIIGSSTLPLNLNNHRWATFRQTKSGIKLYLRLVFMENGCSYPDKAVLTKAKEHDRGQLGFSDSWGVHEYQSESFTNPIIYCISFDTNTVVRFWKAGKPFFIETRVTTLCTFPFQNFVLLFCTTQ